MAEETYHKQLIEQALDREQIQGLVEPRVPSPAKYRETKAVRLGEEETLRDIRPGAELVVQVGGHEIEGYLLGVTLDYEDEQGRWDVVHRVIFQVVAASQPALLEEIGRLRTARIGSGHYWRSYGYHVVKVGGVHWQDYLPSGVPDLSASKPIGGA